MDGYRNRFVYRHVLTPLSMIFYFENLFAFLQSAWNIAGTWEEMDTTERCKVRE